MKLSEAIRLGAMLRPQAFGNLRRDVGHGEYGSCALGAAFESIKSEAVTQVAKADYVDFRGAIVKKGDTINAQTVSQAWYNLLNKVVSCPVCGQAATAERTITHLNDLHRWTREAIAGWVETIEPKKRTKKCQAPSTGRLSKLQREME